MLMGQWCPCLLCLTCYPLPSIVIKCYVLWAQRRPRVYNKDEITVYADKELPGLCGFTTFFGSKKVWLELAKVPSFEDIKAPIDQTNWLLVYSHAFTKSMMTEDSRLIDLFKEAQDLFDQRRIPTRASEFSGALVSVSKYLKKELPYLIEKGFLKDKSIQKELKQRSTLRYKEIESPSYLKEDIDDYKFSGTWLEQLIQEHFYDPFKKHLDEKIKAHEENSDPSSMKKKKNMKLDTFILNEYISKVAEALRDGTNKVPWSQVANFLNAIYYSEFTSKSFKTAMEEDLIYYKPEPFNTESFTSHIDKLRKKAQGNSL